MRPRYYRRDGTPLTSVLEWAKEFENRDNRRVALTDLWWGGRVSTVWLGLDHNFSPNGEPLVFESMVFSFLDNGHVLDMNRYSIETEAITGHNELVRKWSNPFTIFWHFFYHEGIEDWYYDFKYYLRRRRHES